MPPAPAAPVVTVSLDAMNPGDVPTNPFTWVADTVGKMGFKPDDLGYFSRIAWWEQLQVDNDPAFDRFTAAAKNGWAAVRKIQITDADGGTFVLQDFAMPELHLGGTKPSSVTLVNPQYGLVETGAGADTVKVTSVLA
jgi:hypothetical protein